MSADDKGVRAAATQANAMGFIMQNDDDISSAAVQSRITEEFNDLLRRVFSDGSQPANILSLPRLVAQKQVTHKELALITILVPFLSSRGLSRVEEQFEEFLAAVNLKAQQSDVTWQVVLRSFLFQEEAQRI